MTNSNIILMVAFFNKYCVTASVEVNAQTWEVGIAS